MSNDLIKLTGDVRRKPSSTNHDPLDLSAVRARLESKSGAPMGRRRGARPPRPAGCLDGREALEAEDGPAVRGSLEELAGTPAFERYVEEEFPDRAGILNADRGALRRPAGAPPRVSRGARRRP